MNPNPLRIHPSLALVGLCLAVLGCGPGSEQTGPTDANPSVDPGTPTQNAACVPTPLLDLASIPDNPSLNDDDDDTIAIFEVDGHALIGKHVDDPVAAERGLLLWQEFTTRIPENQLGDLVQFEISLDEDPVAYFNRTGDVTTERDGLKIGFSVASFELNDPNPCAPLVPRRGSFDWSLVHEFGHLRGWVDGSWDRFEDAFPNYEGDGDGYPDDGSPLLTGDFVTDYAERADGDEDHAETWTTFVMLGDDAIPPETEGEPLSITKLRWMSEQPGYAALRRAIRISEPGVEVGPVEAAPALTDRTERPQFATPSWMHGVYQEHPTDGRQFEFLADDIIISQLVGGLEEERLSLKEADEAGELFYYELHDGSAALAFSFIELDGGPRSNFDFFYTSATTLEFARETYDPAADELLYFDPISLTRVP